MCKYHEDQLRAADDGMPVNDGNEDDLGPKWGSYSDVETREVHDPVADAIRKAEAAAETGDANFVHGKGKMVSVEAEQALADAAIKAIQSTVGNSSKRRYTLLVFNMDNVDPETTGGDITSYSHISTASEEALIEVAREFAMKQFLATIGQNELEI